MLSYGLPWQYTLCHHDCYYNQIACVTVQMHVSVHLMDACKAVAYID